MDTPGKYKRISIYFFFSVLRWTLYIVIPTVETHATQSCLFYGWDVEHAEDNRIDNQARMNKTHSYGTEQALRVRGWLRFHSATAHEKTDKAGRYGVSVDKTYQSVITRLQLTAHRRILSCSEQVKINHVSNIPVTYSELALYNDQSILKYHIPLSKARPNNGVNLERKNGLNYKTGVVPLGHQSQILLPSYARMVALTEVLCSTQRARIITIGQLPIVNID